MAIVGRPRPITPFTKPASANTAPTKMRVGSNTEQPYQPRCHSQCVAFEARLRVLRIQETLACVLISLIRGFDFMGRRSARIDAVKSTATMMRAGEGLASEWRDW